MLMIYKRIYFLIKFVISLRLESFFIFRDKLVSGKCTFNFIIKIPGKYDLYSKKNIEKTFLE